MSAATDPAPGTAETAPVPPLPRPVGVGRVLTLPLRPRPVVVCVLLALVTFAFFCAGIRLGDLPLSFGEVLRSLVGQGSEVDDFIVHDLRMPRALAGVVVGAALGMSGAIVQSVARNPLASPDVLGVTGGAGLAAVVLVTGTGGLATSLQSGLGLPAFALAGGLATGLLVYLLAMRGGVDGIRLILVGVAVTALTQALTTYLLVRADVREAARAQTWLVGSLDSRTWDQVTATAVIGGLAALVALVTVFALRALQLGDEVAAGLGVRVGRTRGVLLVCAVLLAGAAVATAGPVAFVAFVAPQIALRLTGLPTPPLVPSALTGACLLTGADVVAHSVFPVELPVGIVTAAVGGPFLVYLLVRANLSTSS